MNQEAERLLEVAKAYAQASSSECDFVFRVSKDFKILAILKMMSAPLIPPDQFLNKHVPFLLVLVVVEG